jgi:FkbM family methyltransferase
VRVKSEMGENLMTDKDVWIFGSGGFARRLHKDLSSAGVNVKGFLTSRSGQTSGDITSLDEVKDFSSPVYLGVFNHYDEPVEIESELLRRGFKTIIAPAQYFASPLAKEPNVYYLTGNREHLPSKEDIGRVSAMLADDESRLVLKGLTDYQRGGRMGSIKRSALANRQYLGTTLPEKYSDRWLTQELRWIDVGAFDGDTLRLLQDCRREAFAQDEFICIEPDTINFEKLREWTVKNRVKTVSLNVAAGSSDGWLQFESHGLLSSRATSDSYQSSNRDNLVPQVRLDTICGSWQPTHIKMDIEGAEMGALEGGITTIIKTRPRLAISLYHRPLDPIQIPNYLSERLSDYSWHIRCYGAHGYDTILYGIPN